MYKLRFVQHCHIGAGSNTHTLGASLRPHILPDSLVGIYKSTDSQLDWVSYDFYTNYRNMSDINKAPLVLR